MAILTNTFEGGTDGANISVANSGGASGDAFNVLLLNGTSASSGSSVLTYSDDFAAQGALSGKLTHTASQSYLRWNYAESHNRFAIRRLVYFATAPTTTVSLMTMHNGTGIMADIRLEPGRTLLPYIGTAGHTAGRSAMALAVNTIYWLEIAVTKETGGGGNGKVEWNLTNAAGAVVETYSSPATAATGAIDAQQFRLGGGSTATWGAGAVEWLDTVRAGGIASGWIGPIATALDTPVLTVTENNKPSAPGAADGSVKVTWPAVPGAHHYEAGIAVGDVTTGYTVVSTTATSPYTFTGLTAGEKTVAIRAKATA